MMKKLGLIFMLVALCLGVLSAQVNVAGGKVHGNFQMDFQTYQKDSIIGVTDLGGKHTGMNAFGNLIYENGRFTAGVRYEMYLPPLNGFDDAYKGSGISNRFLRYSDKNIDVTVGNFYEQFGNGLIFRAYEEWTLGIDNSLDGISMKLKAIPGIVLKGVYGTQRYYWNDLLDNDKKPIVRGIDAEFSFNDIFPSFKDASTRLSLGLGFVSKYEKDDPYAKYKLPENVAAYSVRMNLNSGGFNLNTEYAHKINDPNSTQSKGFIYKDGQALLISGSYSRKGMGMVGTVRHLDNFNFPTMRAPKKGTSPSINFLPSVAFQHSYSLLGMYPYTTQQNGEVGFSAEFFYNIPKKTMLGGKYGTKLSFNISRMKGLDKKALDAKTSIGESGTDGYKASFMIGGRTTYYRDIFFKISKKISKKIKFIAGFSSMEYNHDVLEKGVEDGDYMYEIMAGFLDFTWKINRFDAIRTEIQYLNLDDDLGDWALGLIEYSNSPHWFFTVQDQVNIKNPDTNEMMHYYMVGATYVNKGTRLGISYGRQKEGLLCVGGVCRQVKAATGFTVNLTQSF